MTKDKLNAILLSLMGSKTLVDTWWEGYNHAFGMSPKAQYAKDPNVIKVYLEKHTQQA